MSKSFLIDRPHTYEIPVDSSVPEVPIPEFKGAVFTNSTGDIITKQEFMKLLNQPNERKKP